jgi:hypothetical protein
MPAPTFTSAASRRSRIFWRDEHRPGRRFFVHSARRLRVTSDASMDGRRRPRRERAVDEYISFRQWRRAHAGVSGESRLAYRNRGSTRGPSGGDLAGERGFSRRRVSGGRLGDRDYYQSRKPDLWLSLKAVFWPTPSVLHIAAFSGPVASYFSCSEVVALALATWLRTPERFCPPQISQKQRGQIGPIGSGLYGQSALYPAREKFHFFNTCNVWTARVLRAAGLPVTPFFAITMGGVMSQARQFGKTIQSRPAGR